MIGHHNVMADPPAIDHLRFFPDFTQDFVALRIGEQLFSAVRASRHKNKSRYHGRMEHAPDVDIVWLGDALSFVTA